MENSHDRPENRTEALAAGVRERRRARVAGRRFGSSHHSRPAEAVSRVDGGRAETGDGKRTGTHGNALGRVAGSDCGAHLRVARTPGTELDGRAGAVPERDLGAGVDAEHLVQRIGIRATRIRPARGRARPA